jgi:hypothetical protein
MGFEEALALLNQDAIMALYGMYDESEVKLWFHTKHPGLEYHTPYQVLMTVYDYEQPTISQELLGRALDRVDEAAMELNGCDLL